VARWKSVAILGVGLIGGSIGLALRKRGLSDEIVGIGHRQVTLDSALAVQAVSTATTDLAAGVADAEIVIVCTPVLQIVPLVQQIASCCRPDTLITDAGSTKAGLADRLGRILAPSTRYVGSHPLAGSDKSGVGFADADLFQDRVVVVAGSSRNSRTDVEAVTEFWQALGARCVEMTPDDHDRAVAITSHLPHVVASLLAGLTPVEHRSLVAGGWLDTTRIAAADEELWAQILLENRDHLLPLIESYREQLEELTKALQRGDRTALTAQLRIGKQRRNAVAS